MAKARIKGLTPDLMGIQSKEPAVFKELIRKPTVQTVKLPDEVFMRLKHMNALTRKKHQEIILTALLEYLDRNNA